MTVLLVLLLGISLTFLVWGIIAPAHLAKKTRLKKEPTRKHTGFGFGLLSLLLLFLIGATSPQDPSLRNTNQSSSATHSASKIPQQQQPQPKIENKQVQETRPIAFSTVTKNDASLPAGQVRTVQEGKDGVETINYSVTYTNGVETNRVIASQIVTTPAIDKIIMNGTYVAPATCAGGYINVDGNCIVSPNSDAVGATAQCRDGSYSHSQHRSGTCSGHGGVLTWL